MKQHSKEKRMKIEKKNFAWDLIPGILLFAFLPLIVKAKLVQTHLDGYSWFSAEELQYDFFMYWKGAFFLILVLWMAVVLVDRCLIRGHHAFGLKKFLPLIIYGILAVISTVFSVNRTLSLHGAWQHYESIWILLGYMVTVYYCFIMAGDKKNLRILSGALCLGALFQSIFGILQFTGKDFFRSKAGRSLITLGENTALGESLKFDFAQNGRNSVYMASYNPNYAGVYVILLWPILFYLGLEVKERWKKIICMTVTAALLICLIGSGSKTGLLILAVQIIILAILKIRKSGKWWKLLIIFAMLLGGLICYDAANGHVLQKAINNIIPRQQSYALEEISPEKDSVRICFKGHRIDLSAMHTEKGDTLTALNEKGKSLPVVWDIEKQRFYINIKKKGFYYLSFDAFVENGVANIYIFYNKTVLHFQKRSAEDPYVYITQFGKEAEITTAPAVLKGWEKALTGRGYIWGRTIPLLKNCVLWGSGPDTFIVEFPQTDYVTRANIGPRMFFEIPSKAHCMYLQTALQTGMLSLICLLVFWLKYINGYLKLEKNNNAGPSLKRGIFLGIAGYLLMGFLNDSVLAVAPVFWGILGLGMGTGSSTHN